MKVSKPQLFNARPVQSSNAQRSKKEAGEAGKQVSGATDQVGLSEKARFMSQVKQTLLQSDEVRVDKVEHYRSLIEKGEFVVRAGDVAEKMLDEYL